MPMINWRNNIERSTPFCAKLMPNCVFLSLCVCVCVHEGLCQIGSLSPEHEMTAVQSRAQFLGAGARQMCRHTMNFVINCRSHCAPQR